jgi:beta-1,4-N-acetylglucosaminyltransferase
MSRIEGRGAREVGLPTTSERVTSTDPGAAPPARDRRSRPRLALVGSSGGHLLQLLALREFWQDHDRFWVTFQTEDARSLLRGERVYWCHHPTNRNGPNLARNTLLAARVLRRERPDMIISTGAAVAVPFFYLGRAVSTSNVYIEVFDRIAGPTLTGRLVRPVTDHMLVQWPEQLPFYRSAELVGPLL